MTYSTLCAPNGTCEIWAVPFRVITATRSAVRRRARVVDKSVLDALMRNNYVRAFEPVHGPRFDSMSGQGEPDLRMRPAHG